MTVNSATCTAAYTLNGATTSFAVPFYWLVDTDLQVTRLNAATGATSVMVLNSDYSLTGAGNPVGGSLTLLATNTAGDQIYIERDITFVQNTAYPSNSPFPASSHEKALDRDTMGLQQLGSQISRALLYSPLTSFYDLGNKTLVNGGTAVNPTDVPNLQQMQAAIVAGAAPALALPIGASFVGVQRTNLANTIASTIAAWANADVVIPVRDYSFDNTGATDNSAKLALMMAAIQLNQDGRGRRIRLGSGTYKFNTTWAFTAYVTGQVQNIILEGDGPDNTILDFTGCPAGSDGLTFDNGAHIVVRDLAITHAPRDGMYLGKGNTVGGVPYCSLFTVENIRIQNSGRHGFHMTNTYMGTIRGVWSTGNTGNGFQFDGYHTSITSSACWASNNTGVGWALNGMTYSDFLGCGADSNGFQGFTGSNLVAVNFINCGSEANQRDGFLFTSSTASTVGLPLPSINVRGVNLIGCFGLNNSALGAGTFATFVACLTANNGPISLNIKGGSAYPATASDVPLVLNGASGLVTVHTELFDDSNFTAVNVNSGSFELKNLTMLGRRALVQLSAAQSLVNNTVTVVTWSTSMVDNSMGANVASNGIVIPRGVSKVKITASLDYAANTTGVRNLLIQKNSANAVGLPGVAVNATSAGDTIMNASSAVVPVAQGDIITVQGFQNSGGALNISNTVYSWLCVEAIS